MGWGGMELALIIRHNLLLSLVPFEVFLGSWLNNIEFFTMGVQLTLVNTSEVHLDDLFKDTLFESIREYARYTQIW